MGACPGPERRPTLLLSAAETTAALCLTECITAVEEAFRALGEGRTPPSAVLALHAERGGLHVKAARWGGYLVAKSNANFPENPERCGLPAIQGVIVVCDAATGELLALMDSIEVTALRTGAATAVAAKWLARPDSRSLTLCGCGKQGWWQLQALRCVLPIQLVHAYDTAPEAMHAFAERAQLEPGLEVRPVRDFAGAVGDSDIVVTCTPARSAFLRAAHVRPGTFVAAVGADNEHKQEVEPALFARSKVVVDSLAQCSTMGDLHHALAAGAVRADKVHAELSEVVAGRKTGRTSPDEVTLFDSTGIALEDAAAAAIIYERAAQTGVGTRSCF